MDYLFGSSLQIYEVGIITPIVTNNEVAKKAIAYNLKK